MQNNFTQHHNLNKNNILQRFQDGKISIGEAFALLTDNNTVNKLNNNSTNEQVSTPLPSESNLDKKNTYDDNISSLEELNQLVGLREVKELIKDYISFIKVQKIRQSYGLKSQPLVMHMVFKGNPGTGKTTVARIVGNIFNELGFLENGKLVETERAELVGEYIGHTAKKTKEKIKEAMGGVLFIDEAYSLARGGKRDFGRESIDTLVKGMEDHRNNLIIILAGYREEMEIFLNSNPGLHSRLAIHLNFSDYSIDELVQIAKMMFEEREYILAPKSKHYIYRTLSQLRQEEGISKGNARTVRNLVERAIRRQARRIMDNNCFKKKDLMTIKSEDLARGEP